MSVFAIFWTARTILLLHIPMADKVTFTSIIIHGAEKRKASKNYFYKIGWKEEGGEKDSDRDIIHVNWAIGLVYLHL